MKKTILINLIICIITLICIIFFLEEKRERLKIELADTITNLNPQAESYELSAQSVVVLEPLTYKTYQDLPQEYIKKLGNNLESLKNSRLIFNGSNYKPLSSVKHILANDKGYTLITNNIELFVANHYKYDNYTYDDLITEFETELSNVGKSSYYVSYNETKIDFMKLAGVFNNENQFYEFT